MPAGATPAYFLKRASNAALDLATSPSFLGTNAPAFGLKKSQKFARVFSRTSSAIGSRQCLAYEVSYSTHIRQTCSSELHALHTSRRRNGRLRAEREASQFQQVRVGTIRISHRPIPLQAGLDITMGHNKCAIIIANFYFLIYSLP